MFKKSLLLALAVLMSCGLAFSQKAYPSKKITLIVPFAAGGGTDAVARKLADMAKKELGQDVVVMNLTGGSGAIGMTNGAAKAADGYTLTMVTRELSWLHQMGLAKITPNDFKAVSLINEDPAVLLVKANSPYLSAKDVIEAATAAPNKLKFGSTAKPNFYLLALELHQKIKFNQIPYNGAAEALPALLGGHVDLSMMSPGEAFGQIKDGSLKALAVASDVRFSGLPNTPTFNEQGYPLITGTWRGIAVPAKTPQKIIDQLEAAFLKITSSEEFITFMQSRNFGVRYMSAAAFQKYMLDDAANLEAIILEIKKNQASQ